MLPPIDKALGQIKDTHVVSNLRLARLGDYSRRHFRDERVWALFEDFQRRLRDHEKNIIALNTQRPAPYTMLLPSQIAQSIVV
mgnify:FL=1